jgi:hypothetical protein
MVRVGLSTKETSEQRFEKEAKERAIQEQGT